MARVVSTLTDYIAQNPHDEEALRVLGEIYLKFRRDYQAAVPIYERLMEINPADRETRMTLLGLYRNTRNFDGMRRIYEIRLAQAGGDDPALHLCIAQTELRAGRGEKAVEYAKKHLGGDEAKSYTLQMLAMVYDKAGQHHAAIATLDAALSRAENDRQRAGIQFQKADMLIWDKRYADAEVLLRTVRENHSEDATIRSRADSELIRIYQTQGRLRELEL